MKSSIFLLLLITLECDHSAVKNPSSEIQNTSEDFPFSIIDNYSDTIYFNSFEGADNGRVVFELFVDQTGKKLSYNILFYQLLDRNGKSILKYYESERENRNKDTYPNIINKSKSVFDSFIDSIDIKEKSNTIADGQYVTMIPKMVKITSN